MKKLKDYRKEAKLTQKQLREAANLSAGTLSSLETGTQTNPRYESLIKIAEVLSQHLGKDKDALTLELLGGLREKEARSQTFNLKLKDYRKEAKLTQKQLSEQTDLAVWKLSSFETGAQKNPSDEALARIAAALAVRLGKDRDAIIRDLLRARERKEERS